MKRLHRIVGAPALLVVAALFLAACGSSGTSGGTATTAAGTRPRTNAKLEIVAPTANQTTGRDITVELKVIGGEVVPQTTGRLVADKGHIHVSLDGKLVSMAYGTSQELHDLTPGPHTIQAEFVAIDHAPFRNRAAASVLFTVQQ